MEKEGSREQPGRDPGEWRWGRLRNRGGMVERALGRGRRIIRQKAARPAPRSPRIRCSNNTSLLLSLTRQCIEIECAKPSSRRSPFSLSRLLHSPITSFEATSVRLQLCDDDDTADIDGRSLIHEASSIRVVVRGGGGNFKLLQTDTVKAAPVGVGFGGASHTLVL